MLRLIYLAMTVTILSLSSPSFATFRELHTSISNQTGVDCQLIQQENVHGIVESAPPSSLLNGVSGAFDMKESFLYGPDEILTYECGTNKQLKFEVFKPLQGPAIHGVTPEVYEILSNGLGIRVSIQSVGLAADSAGVINIDIINKN